MNVARAFADYLATVKSLTLGQNLFISRVPSSNQVGNRTVWWIKANGGTVVSRGVQGSAVRQYLIEIYCRDVSAEGLYETLQALGDSLTTAGCMTLAGYDVIHVDTNGPWTDQDLDSEERTVGLLQVKLTINLTT